MCARTDKWDILKRMEALSREAKARFGLDVDGLAVSRLETYERLLSETNGKFNVTALRTAEDVRIRHFLDSMACMLAWRSDPAPARMIDVGSGAGFPGLVLSILLPNLKLTLLESVGKKADFCRRTAAELGLQNVTVITGRAETFGTDPGYRERFDCAVARAVAPLAVLVEYLLPFVRVGGIVLAPKGAKASDELRQAGPAIAVLGGTVREMLPVVLPGDTQPRHLIILSKTHGTPAAYPRSVGIPAAHPLS
jgi:16S rRNA (guanine527-N7)-methyltransferase